jgi:hypothetical protein
MKLVRITDSVWFKKLGCAEHDQGVYYYHAVDLNLKPKPINRVLKTDPLGILYIGHTPGRRLAERIADFRKCVLPGYKGSGHSAGRTYKSINKLAQAFPPDTIAVRVVVSKDKELEKKLINEYKQEFGEVPPLSSH